MELAMGRRPRYLMDPASMNPEQLTSTPTNQDLLKEEIQKLAMKAHLEVRQREDIRRDLAERTNFVPPDLRVGENQFYWPEDPSKIQQGRKSGKWLKVEIIALKGSKGERIIWLRCFVPLVTCVDSVTRLFGRVSKETRMPSTHMNTLHAQAHTRLTWTFVVGALQLWTSQGSASEPGLPERDDVRPVNRASHHDPTLQSHLQHTRPMWIFHNLGNLLRPLIPASRERVVPTEWQIRTIFGDCISRARVIQVQAPHYRQYALISDFLVFAHL